MNQNMIKQLEPVFYPRSIAVVGASNDKRRFSHGSRYLQTVLKNGFQGELYALHHSADSLLGVKAYPSLISIPGPVDYLIVSIPAHRIPSLLDDCAAKGVKIVQMYTAGFSESGTEQGRLLEEEIVSKARAGGFRLLGPNCLGIYYPPHMVTWTGRDRGTPRLGSIGFISQSGQVFFEFISSEIGQRLGISKAISFGNGCDLDSTDFLEYLGSDPETEIIGAYLEGVKDGRRLVQLLGEISKTKPVVIYKGGRTEAGARLTASHTGSLAGSDAIWTAALKQTGAIRAGSFEELIDTLSALKHLSPFTSNRVGLIAGILGGGGAASVAAGDACTSQGLVFPPTREETRSKLAAILPPEGSLLHNPIDKSSTGADLESLAQVMDIALSDPAIDLFVLYVGLDLWFSQDQGEDSFALLDLLERFRNAQHKPLVVVSTPAQGESQRPDIQQRLSDARIPVYPSFERAARSITNVIRYWRFRTESEGNS